MGNKVIPVISMIAAIASLVPAAIEFRKNRKAKKSRKKSAIRFIPDWTDTVQDWTGQVACLRTSISKCMEDPTSNLIRVVTISDEGKFVFEIFAEQRTHAKIVHTLKLKGFSLI